MVKCINVYRVLGQKSSYTCVLKEKIIMFWGYWGWRQRSDAQCTRFVRTIVDDVKEELMC